MRTRRGPRAGPPGALSSGRRTPGRRLQRRTCPPRRCPTKLPPQVASGLPLSSPLPLISTDGKELPVPGRSVGTRFRSSYSAASALGVSSLAVGGASLEALQPLTPALRTLGAEKERRALCRAGGRRPAGARAASVRCPRLVCPRPRGELLSLP